MVISQPPGNNPSYYYRASPTHSIALNASETPYVLYMQLQHQNSTHRNGAIKHGFLHESDPRKRIISRLFFIHFVAHALALHLAVKILLQIFLYEDLSTLTLHTSVGCFLRMPTGPHFVTQQYY